MNGELMTQDLGGLTVIESPSPGGVAVVRHALEELKAFRTFVKEELRENLDYGKVPGTDKPTLLQPGAQKIAMYHNAYPDSEVQARELGDGHVEYLVKTRLISRGSGRPIGQGLGTCSTMEGRYRYRHAHRKCPECGGSAIIEGRPEYGGGWVCFKKKGGCGAKFPTDDRRVAGQAVGRVENDNIHDARNTVLKMAVKRSFVAASLALGCASEMFTQDLEDTYDLAGAPPAAPAPPAPPEVADAPARDETARRKREINEEFPPAAPAPPAAARAPRLEELPRPTAKTRAWWDTTDEDDDGFAKGWMWKLLDRWEASVPMPETEDAWKKEMISRQHRIAHDLVSRAVAEGRLDERSICKPAAAGKPPARDPRKVWEAVHGLLAADWQWVKAATLEHLKKFCVAEPSDQAPPAAEFDEFANDAEARAVLGPGADG